MPLCRLPFNLCLVCSGIYYPHLAIITLNNINKLVERHVVVLFYEYISIIISMLFIITIVNYDMLLLLLLSQ